MSRVVAQVDDAMREIAPEDLDEETMDDFL
jgi:hypothetical protein